MAQVIVNQPNVGHINVISTEQSAYQVEWVPNGASATFTRFVVICDQCGLTMITSNANPSTFDISALVSAGHPGPFEIYVQLEYDVTILLYTHVAEGQGTTAPLLQDKGAANVGDVVTFSITATPAEGYKFLGWSTDPYSTNYFSTNASTTVSYTVTSADVEAGSEQLDVYAHFGLESYIYQLDVEYRVTNDPTPTASGGTNRRASGFRSSTPTDQTVKHIRLYYQGDLYQNGVKVYSGANNIAMVNGAPNMYTIGQTITVSLAIQDQALWNLLGLRLVGWRIRKGYPSGTSTDPYYFVADDNYSTSFVADHAPRSASSPYYEVAPIICTADVYKITFKSVPFSAATLLLNCPNPSTAADPTVRRNGEIVAFVAAGDLLNLEVLTILKPLAFIHGWSQNLPDSLAPVQNPVESKDLTMPAYDTEVDVYICTHRLIYGYAGWLLHGSQGSLLYDCAVPPNTPVYD